MIFEYLEPTPVLTALIALIGVILTALIGWWNSKKQFNGLVISQSRINWIQDVRINAAKYLKHMTEIKISIEKIKNASIEIEKYQGELVYKEEAFPEEDGEWRIEEIPNPNFQAHNDNRDSKINSLKNEKSIFKEKLHLEKDRVKETSQLLRLYLPKQDKEGKVNADHKELQDIMDEIQAIIDDSTDDKELDVAGFNEGLDKFTDDISAYLKQEWEKSKKNK